MADSEKWKREEDEEEEEEEADEIVSFLYLFPDPIDSNIYH